MLKLEKVEEILFFLTLLLLPTQLGKHFWFPFSYVYSLKIDYLSPTLYFWDVLVIGLLLVWFLKRPSINKAALKLLLFFILTQALSLLKAENLGAGLFRLEQLFIAGSFGVLLASLDFKNLPGKILLPLCLAALSQSLIAVLQFSHSKTLGLWFLGERSFTVTTPAIAKFDFYGRQFLRPYATFPHPNVLAGYLLICAVILRRCFSLLVGSQSTARPRLLTAFFLSGLAIFLTMSRTAILAAFFLLIWLCRKRIRTIIIIMFILSPILFTRFFSVFNFDSLTVIRRGELIEQAWQIFLKSPVFGVGLNNFIPAAADNLLTGPSRFLQPVHNIILLALAETGIVGLAGFIFLIGYPIIKMQNSKTKDRQRSVILLWAIVFFLGMFDHYFLTLPQGYRLLFFVWGIHLSMLK